MQSPVSGITCAPGGWQASSFAASIRCNPYIVDFYCDAPCLVIELDGSQHTEEADAQRTLSLEAQGVMVLRFWSDQVLKETVPVLEEIYRVAMERIVLLRAGR